jgi:hypothetical protein
MGGHVSWVDALAKELGVAPLSEDETAVLLDAAREVAHGVERRVTPLSTFLIGSAVAAAEGRGVDRAEAFDEAVKALRGAVDAAP